MIIKITLMKKYTFLILLFSTFSFSQENKNAEQFPVFESCKTQTGSALETCFYNRVQDFVFKTFKVPENLIQNKYQGNVIVVFEVDEKGTFKPLYVDANQNELIEEGKRIFGLFPTIDPPTFNGKPTYSKYTIRIPIPLQNEQQTATFGAVSNEKMVPELLTKKEIESPEYDNIVYKKFENPQYKSNLNIPFSHSFYAHFDAAMNQVGTNNHTATKPYTYSEISKYYNLEEKNAPLLEKTSNWWSRKLFNENLVQIQGENYWFTMNPILDLQVGKSKSIVSTSTFVNTRGIQVQGGLGEQLNFTTTIYESQARFADYFNQYAISIRPSGAGYAIIPGIGIAKDFKTDAFDLPLAEANLTFQPNKMINLQLGYGRNFVGDGYRSLITTDGITPYPFVKINTNFWKIKYTNTFMWLNDVREDVTAERTFSKKYVANHYLSWNATKRFNIGFFESVVWADTNNRGFDMNFVNPIIFYRSVEFASSARSGNALLGLTSKYKFNNQINFYGQFLLDEFSLGDVKKQEGSWKNKYAYQLGVKYFNAFGIENLLLQAEYNHVRPYVYSHSDPLTNYGHNNQSLGHQWGGNQREFLVIGRYHKDRWFADAKMTFGKRGFDFNTTDPNSNYGGDIYRGYDENRAFDTNVKVGQGNTTSVFIADLQAGYLVNPITNLKLFGSLIYRNFNPTIETPTTIKDTTTWFSVGIRSDVFNWYFDY
jgi:hypothetical protein